MMKLALGLACLLIAALLAAVGYVLARPKWRWERTPNDDEVEPWDGNAYIPSPGVWSSGSPESVTSRTYDNGSAWSAAVNSPDDAARWAGG